jgi:hypothetical protein
MNKDKFDYVSVDSHVATSGVETMQGILDNLWCRGCARVWRDKKEEKKKMANPNLCRTLPRRMKRFYAHNTSDSDRESFLGLEKSYFELRSKVCTKQMSIKRFFQQEVIIIIKLILSIIFNGFLVFIVFPYVSFLFSIPLKNDASRFYCTVNYTTQFHYSLHKSEKLLTLYLI